ncbi:hypothetical protein Hypma_008118 [Hypsizygus marmoreus]|uniref:Uncharacterized protein n=1 Tax=Hypsizygus marmoreus TaxID=39966 RepID=A0A369JS75_HYPMA|nr:hypothetical protein Hypma_008118 [Hypsizygus marmoreus]
MLTTPADSTNGTVRTPAMMPSPQAKEAPKTFTGSHEDVQKFIKWYNSLCTTYNIPEAEKSLSSYVDRKWNVLEKDLLCYYDADQRDTHYNIHDLKQLYEHKFITISSWLHAKKKISEDEQAGFFWQGINKSLREKIKNHIAAENPTISLIKAFLMETVISIVGKIFECNRFDYNLAESDSDLPD